MTFMDNLGALALSDYELTALWLSLKISSMAVFCSLPIGIFTAWGLARFDFKGKAFLDGIIHLPLVLPPVVIGYLLLISLGSQGWLGQWLYDWFGIDLSFNWKGAALAAAVVSFPLMVRSIRLAIEAVDIKLEQAATTLGASATKVFFTITLPLTLPGILAGTIMAFARCLGEFGATITFVSNIPQETQTLPLAMFSFIETPGAELAAARLCIIAIIIALASLMASEWLTRRMLVRQRQVQPNEQSY